LSPAPLLPLLSMGSPARHHHPPRHPSCARHLKQGNPFSSLSTLGKEVLSFHFSCHVLFTIPPSDICVSFGVVHQDYMYSTAHYGSISPHHTSSSATLLIPFPRMVQCHKFLCIRGSLSYSYDRKCGSACRESAVDDRGSPHNHSKIAQVLSPAVCTPFCSDSSCCPVSSRHSTPSQTPSSSGRSSSPGSWSTSCSSFRRERLVLHS
jgi:hypothetical protein